MKINFKIMWVDDKPDKMKPILDEIEEMLGENYYIPQIEKAFGSYDDFMAIFDLSKEDDGGINVFNDCDLLLIDLHLSERFEDDEKTGEALIEQIRNKGVFTEVVFYSDAMAEYRQSSSRRELDNVTYADKSEVVRKVEHLIIKSVRQGMNISNLRGYLMDSTSEFDFVCKEVAIHFFKLLGETQQKAIVEKVEEYIQAQYESEAEKFKRHNAKYQDIFSQVKRQGAMKAFSTVADAEQRTAILSDALNSKFAVMPNEKKYRILAKILFAASIDASEKICMYHDGKPDELYKKALISPRNRLAHSKLIYGERCGNRRIKIVEALSEIDCEDDGLCNTDTPACSDKSYSYEDCKTLRKNIYEFYLLFNDLIKSISCSK
jgi:hypothetical protein